MNIVFETRFSFIGKSGWQSDFSRSPEKIFAPERINKRFEYFEKIALESLKDQNDPSFKLLVLSALRMPEKQKKQLTELCKDSLGDERCEIVFSGWGVAGRVFRRNIQSIFIDNLEAPLAQVVLDDDDGVSNDFVEVCRAESQFAFSRLQSDSDYTYLSFPKGYSMLLENDVANLKLQRSPYINLGLTLVARASTSQNPFLVSHKMIGERRPTRVIDDSKPYYLRTVHNLNDSFAKQLDFQGDTSLETASERFPLLKKFENVHKL